MEAGNVDALEGRLGWPQTSLHHLKCNPLALNEYSIVIIESKPLELNNKLKPLAYHYKLKPLATNVVLISWYTN